MSALAAAEITAYLADGRRRVDDALEKTLPPLGTPPASLHEAMRYTALLPGKRLRGIVVLASCELLKGEPETALPLAVAVELVHASSLILDDLPSMDNATLRRGRPTLHRVAGEANAILASVGLLNMAFATVTAAPGTVTASAGGSTSTITVTAKDAFGNPLQGLPVTLAATGSGNLLTQPQQPTDASGATAGRLAATVAGQHVVSATISGQAIPAAAPVTW